MRNLDYLIRKKVYSIQGVDFIFQFELKKEFFFHNWESGDWIVLSKKQINDLGFQEERQD